MCAVHGRLVCDTEESKGTPNEARRTFSTDVRLRKATVGPQEPPTGSGKANCKG